MNSFAGLFRIESEAKVKETGRSEVTEFATTHSFSYKEGSDIPIDISFWGARGKTAATILNPGDLIFATGSLSFREWKGKWYYSLTVSDYKKVSGGSQAKKRETLSDDSPPVIDDEFATGLPF